MNRDEGFQDAESEKNIRKPAATEKDCVRKKRQFMRVTKTISLKNQREKIFGAIIQQPVIFQPRNGGTGAAALSRDEVCTSLVRAHSNHAIIIVNGSLAPVCT